MPLGLLPAQLQVKQEVQEEEIKLIFWLVSWEIPEVLFEKTPWGFSFYLNLFPSVQIF